MTVMLAIATNTFREAVRDKILYLILFFAALVIFGSELLSVLAVGAASKVALDLGLAAISFLGALASIFLGLAMVAREVERRTVFSVLAKPISRHQFIAGKFLGLYATVFVLTLLMSVLFLGFVGLRHGVYEPALLYAIVLFLIEDLVLASFALLFSSFTTPILGMLFSVTVYLVGHLSFGLKMLADYPSLVETWSARALLGLYYVLPNLERFNVKGAVVHGDPLPEGLLFPSLYGITYALAVFLLASEIFRRRDFV